MKIGRLSLFICDERWAFGGRAADNKVGRRLISMSQRLELVNCT